MKCSVRSKKIIEQVGEFVGNHMWLLLIMSYLLIAICLSSQLDNVFYKIWGDELFYNEMARSIVESGSFKFAHIDIRAGAYLYPTILAIILRFFYNPYTITYITRLVGILLMCSTLFPTYLLAKKMKYSSRNAYILAIASILIPDILQSWFTVTEVLAYPLFMWTVLIIYLDIEKRNSRITPIAVAIFCYMCYQTRGQAIILAIAYIGYMFLSVWLSIKKSDKVQIKNKINKTISFSIIFGSLYLLMPKLLMCFGAIANTKTMETAHASSVFSRFLTEPSYYIWQWGIGVFWYVFYIFLGFGFFTVVLPFFYSKYKGEDSDFRIFINLSLLLTVLIVVLIMYSIEEPLDFSEHRVHMRYFMYFYAPYLLLLYKIDFKCFEWKRIYSVISIVFISFICFGRYIYSLRDVLGTESMSLTIYRHAKMWIIKYPALEQWTIVGTIVVLAVIYLCISKLQWQQFMGYIFPTIITVITIANMFLYISDVKYVTAVGQGDYIARNAPIAEVLNEYNSGEVVLISEGLGYDNEIQTLQLILEKSVDIMSINEINQLFEEQGENIAISEFDRTGYLYLSGGHRLLSDAKCVGVRNTVIDEYYTVSNKIIYQDNYFVIFDLDNGMLHLKRRDG